MWGINSARKRKIKSALLGKQKGKCFYCKCPVTYKTATLDHFEARAKGGKTNSGNFRLACRPCNLEKGQMNGYAFLEQKQQSILRTPRA